MTKFKLWLPVLLTASFFISSCSDSGSSSSGSNLDNLDGVDAEASGGSTSFNEIDDFSEYAGRYRGMIVIDYEATAINVSASRSEEVIIDIDRNGNATVTIDDIVETVQLQGDRINITRDVRVNYEDIICNGQVAVNAQLTRSDITGNGNGDGRCGNDNISTPVDVVATLSLQRQ